MNKVAVLILLALPLFSFTPFEKEASESKKGRESYSKGEMDKAGEEFSKASVRLKNNAEAFYNMGNAKLKAGDNEGALDAYRKSLETGNAVPELKSRIFHNMGNAMTSMKKLEDAEKYYIRSLIEKPQTDTAENLEIVRRMIKQQQQQQQQQEQQKKDQQEQDNKQEEQKDSQDKQEQQEQQEQQKQQEDQAKQDEEKKEEKQEVAQAEEKKDEDEKDKKEDRKAILKQFDQRKNLQISPFMLKKESDSQNGQTW
ncbi:MAG TPA: tetratricopeptide repeat protein [bacterium]|nr:tetratricopeptide repeat protein [bacterium]HPS29225.1 tetratricopeptide repeat protein [bacterium]